MASEELPYRTPPITHNPEAPHPQPQEPHFPSQAPHTQSEEPPLQPAVRFASVNQEIEPTRSLQAPVTAESEDLARNNEISPEDQEQLRTMSRNLNESQLQRNRMSNYAFEPVSLPVSRVPTNETNQNQPSREASRSGKATPRVSPLSSAAEGLGDHSDASGADLAKVHPDPQQMAPQRLPNPRNDNLPSAASSNPPSRPSSASDQASTKPTSHSQGSSGGETAPKVPRFAIGTSGDSSIRSRGTSPSGRSGTVTPPTSYSRPFTPVGEIDDPYARSKRAPQNQNLGAIDQRFVFGSIENRRRSAYVPSTDTSTASLPRSSSGSDLKSQHRHSTFSMQTLGGRKDQHGHHRDDSPSAAGGKQHGSMSDLKRFFGIGHHKAKRSQSPSTARGTKTPPHQLPAANVPFADDHGLQTKYGKFGKVLGSGAGGSVRLIKRSGDGTTFAVKQFRDRHTYESERDYSKKVTAEFCIGSTLHHGNIIETLDIIHERGHWYEIMEYAPYELFAIVMTGKMSREEIYCSFLQIVNGVSFLHGMGLAHRDLKLDNVVVNEHGIMKLIDFGSASVFRYPFENDIILASGIVGSDPYLAPEVYDIRKYDPQPADIWSLAVIYACMALRRFPWKAPRLTDNSYRLFASPPTAATPSADVPSRKSSAINEDSNQSSTSDRPRTSDTEGSTRSHHHHHRHHHEKHVDTDEQSPSTPSTVSHSSRSDGTGKEVLKGPWRLLRLLPRETRGIIGLMLEIDPGRRATMEDLLQDPWVTQTPVCHQEEGGRVVKAAGHHHTLERSTAVSAAESKP